MAGPSPLRVSLSQSVAELRQALGLSDSARLCLARYCGELRPLVNPERSLKLEGFHRNSRVSRHDGDGEGSGRMTLGAGSWMSAAWGGLMINWVLANLLPLKAAFGHV